jgi:enamine deaminase RidA (YjgF/YER057c/UK114 family)
LHGKHVSAILELADVRGLCWSCGVANSPALSANVAKPLSRYAPFRRAGDLVFFAGIIAADPTTMKVIKGYSDLPPEARRLAGETGEMSTDMKDGPIAAQSWWILNSLRLTVEAAGGTLNDVVKLTQYFRNLRDFPIYNRIRASFFVEPPASTVVQISELLPTSDSLLEVDATAYIPLKPAADVSR